VNDNQNELKKRFTKNLKHIALIAMPLITLQASLAFLYVPIVFGEQWVEAIPILTLLCLSALPRPLAESASALVLATGKISIDFNWNVIMTTLFVVSVYAASHYSLFTVASVVLTVYALTHPLYLAYAWKRIFNQRENLASSSTSKLKGEH